MRRLCLALGMCVALVACGGDEETFYRGGVGESCTSRNDCQDPLICDRGVCAASPTMEADGGATSTPAVLSGPGESCTKTADCLTGYRCFDAVCALAAPVPAPEKTDAAIVNVVVLPVDGGAPSNPVLGGRGETCTTSSDCEQGLICLPLSGTSGLGICDFSTYGLETGSNTCSAECKQDTDCCELPLGLTGVAPEAGTVSYKSCADLLKAMTPYIGSNCEAQPSISHECFLYKTYCDCAVPSVPPWKCTAGRCSYTGSCDPTVTATDVMKGCPSKTRASFPVDSCNATTKTCAAVAATGGCRTDADCSGSPVADDAADTCSPNECLCLLASGTCYRKCTADLDCAPNYTCDPTQKLCKPAGTCTTDAFCAVTMKNAGAKCAPLAADPTAKTCRLPCNSDQDCSPSGLAGSVFTGSVCGADHFCGALGCTSDGECSLEIPAGSSSLGAVKMFCVPPAATATTQWASAITD
jgi:hypothetical protein